MISRARFNQYREFVTRSDVHTVIEDALRAGNGGRPRALHTDVLLAAMVATFTHHRTLSLVAVHHLLTEELDRRLQVELGVRDAQGNPITVRQVRYLWNTITALYEHSEARTPDLDEHDRTARAANFQAVLDQLLASATTHIGPAGRYAIDGTAIESAARGKRRPVSKKGKDGDAAARPADDTDTDDIDDTEVDDAEDPDDRVGRCFDPDGRWGYRTRTYDNKTSMMFGYQMIAFTGVADVEAPGSRPLLTERIAVVPGNRHGVPETIAGLDRMLAEETAVLEVLSDRGFSYKGVEDWARPLAERGIAQVLDMHKYDRGSRPHQHGYVMIDGWAHCPSIPDHLVRIDRPARFTVGEERKDATPDEKADRDRRLAEVAEFNRLIAERRTYRFERVGHTSSGAERMICPAKAGKVSCASCPLSQLFEDVPEVTPPAGEPPRACKQATITIRAAASEKLRQREYWGSPEWQASYGRRSQVEAGFGLLKSAKVGGVRRGWTHQVGLVKTTFLLAIAVAATNLRQLLTWAARTGDTRDPITAMDTRGHGFIELDEHGNLPAAIGPPAA